MHGDAGALPPHAFRGGSAGQAQGRAGRIEGQVL